MERSRFADQSLERLSPGGAASKIALKTKNRRLPFESGIHPTSSLILEESYEKSGFGISSGNHGDGSGRLGICGIHFSQCAPGLAPLHQNQHDVGRGLYLQATAYLLSSPMKTPNGCSEISPPWAADFSVTSKSFTEVKPLPFRSTVISRGAPDIFNATTTV